MTFEEDQLALVTAAEEFVTHSLNDGRSFLMFGLVMQLSGEINLAQPSDEFANDEEALKAVQAHMNELASAGTIRACLVCAPVVALSQIAAVFFHVESANGRPVAYVSRSKRQGNGAFHLSGRDPAPVQAFAFAGAQQQVPADVLAAPSGRQGRG